MDMKTHILAALREQLNNWEALLARLDDTHFTAPVSPGEWSVKDEIVHLWAWQQRSIARLGAACSGREPAFPEWLPDLDPEAEVSTEWIHDTYGNLSWPEAYRNWRAGYHHLLELGEMVSERDLLDSGKYPWLGGFPLAVVLLGTYDHHQEHFEKLTAALQEG
jgi:hypothetical protein